MPSRGINKDFNHYNQNRNVVLIDDIISGICFYEEFFLIVLCHSKL